MCSRIDNQEVGLEAATLERVRNSSLVEWLCAENVPGLSILPKLRISTIVLVVGERSVQRRSYSGSGSGAYRSENAGVSSEMLVRIQHTV